MRQFWQRYSGSILICLFFFSSMLPYWDILLNQDLALFYRDLTNVQMPLKSLLVRGIHDLHRIPHWNPYLWSGSPFLTDPSNSLLYPLNLIYLFFSLENIPRAIVFFIALHHSLFFLGTFLLLRTYKVKLWLTLFGALAISWSGFLFSAGNLLHLLGSVLAAPYFLFFWRSITRSSNPIYLPLMGACIGWPVLAGDPQVSLILALLFLILEFTSKRFSFQRAVPVFLFSILFSAPQLLPTILYKIDETIKADPALSLQTQWSLNPERLWELFFHGIFGNQPNDFYTGKAYVHHNEFGYPFIFQIYIGSSLLFPLLLMRKNPLKRSRSWLTALVAFFLILLPMGSLAPVPVYSWIFEILPPWRLFRYPERTVFWACLFLSILAIIKADRLFRTKARPSPIAAFLPCSIFAGFVLWARFRDIPIAPIFPSAGIFFVSLTVFYQLFKKLKSPEAAFGLLLCVDLFLFSRTMIWPESVELTKTKNLIGIEKILNHQKSNSEAILRGSANRMFATDENQHINRDLLGSVTVYSASIAQQWALGLLNIPAFFGLETILGYSTLPPHQSIAWNLKMPQEKLLKMNSVGYVLRRNREGVAKAFFLQNSLPYVLLPKHLEPKENPSALAERIIDESWDPAESTLFLGSDTALNPQGPIPPHSIRVEKLWDRIRVSIQSRENGPFPGVALINESFHKNWRAWAGNRAVKPIEANGWAILIPFSASDFAGDSLTIELAYSEVGFSIGCGLFFLWIVLFALIWIKKNPLGRCNQVGRNSKSTFAKN